MEHTCNGKASPACKACWGDIDMANEAAAEDRRKDEDVVINAPGNRGVIAKVVNGGVWHFQ
jgi:hypothetical protein